MNKAEKFISNCTKNCSNEFEPQKAPPSVYNPWLTPDQARKAVEIAREETIEKACDIIRHKYGHYHYLKGDITEELIREFRKVMGE